MVQLLVISGVSGELEYMSASLPNIIFSAQLDVPMDVVDRATARVLGSGGVR